MGVKLRLCYGGGVVVYALFRIIINNILYQILTLFTCTLNKLGYSCACTFYYQ